MISVVEKVSLWINGMLGAAEVLLTMATRLSPIILMVLCVIEDGLLVGGLYLNPPAALDPEMDCNNPVYVPYSELSLTYLQQEYSKKFGDPPSYKPLPPKLTPRLSRASVNLTDLSKVAIKCGTLAAQVTPVSETDAEGPAVNGSKPFPWVVYVRTSSRACAGVLISDSWVLTPAGCVDSTSTVTLGVASVRIRGKESESINSIASIFPRAYATQKSGNDIGLVKLEKPVQWTDYIRPVCVPATGADFNRSKCFLFNWSRFIPSKNQLSDDINYIPAQILDKYECNYRMTIAGTPIKESEFCLALAPGEYRPGTCNVDSGGPVVCEERGVYFVAGTSSHIKSECIGQFLPDAVTRVAPFDEWITKTMAAF